MMWNVIRWFTKRRWDLKKWTKDYSSKERTTLYFNMLKCNLSGCTDSAVIRHDLRRCLKLTAEDILCHLHG